MKLPSAEEWAAQYTDELEKMLRHYGQALLEAAAVYFLNDEELLPDARKFFAFKVRKLKESP